MSNISSPSFSLQRPPDGRFVDIVRALAREADTLRAPFFLAGAAARDLLLVNVWGFSVSRATVDVDFAFALQDWETLEQLKGRLLATRRFRPDQKRKQRLLYQDDRPLPIPVDLIPFRGVATEPHVIEWPPDGDFVMNVAGFEEVLAASVTVELEPGLFLSIASLCGLALLKLIAWRDRNDRTNRDAADLWRILSCYAQAGNEDRLYGPDIEMLELVNYDFERAGAVLLGGDVRKIADPVAHGQINPLLIDPNWRAKLVLQMSDSTRLDPFERVEQLFDDFGRSYLR